MSERKATMTKKAVSKVFVGWMVLRPTPNIAKDQFKLVRYWSITGADHRPGPLRQVLRAFTTSLPRPVGVGACKRYRPPAASQQVIQNQEPEARAGEAVVEEGDVGTKELLAVQNAER